MLVKHLLDGCKALVIAGAACLERVLHALERFGVYGETPRFFQVRHPLGDCLRVAPAEFEKLAFQVGRNQDIHGRRRR